jgi:hypothetical protein
MAIALTATHFHPKRLLPFIHLMNIGTAELVKEGGPTTTAIVLSLRTKKRLFADDTHVHSLPLAIIVLI